MKAKIRRKLIVASMFALLATGCGDREAMDSLKNENRSLQHALDNEKTGAERLKNERNRLQTNLIEAINTNLLLSERIAEIEAQLEYTNESLSGFDKIEKLNQSARTLFWNSAIDEILIYLNRVKKESHMFSAANDPLLSRQSLLAIEEKRLITSARNIESSALVTVSELTSQQFPKSDVLEKQIKSFTSNYCLYVSSLRYTWGKVYKPLPTFGTGWREEAAKRRTAYQNKKTNQKNYQVMSGYIKSCNVNLNNITRLKIKTRK